MILASTVLSQYICVTHRLQTTYTTFLYRTCDIHPRAREHVFTIALPINSGSPILQYNRNVWLIIPGTVIFYQKWHSIDLPTEVVSALVVMVTDSVVVSAVVNCGVVVAAAMLTTMNK